MNISKIHKITLSIVFRLCEFISQGRFFRNTEKIKVLRNRANLPNQKDRAAIGRDLLQSVFILGKIFQNFLHRFRHILFREAEFLEQRAARRGRAKAFHRHGRAVETDVAFPSE